MNLTYFCEYLCGNLVPHALQVFDAISYCKGSTVVRMVAAVLGPDMFREGLSLYMAKHKARKFSYFTFVHY